MTEETKLNCSVNHNYREGYQQGRADVIDECIKIVNKAYYDNDSLKMIVKYFEQLKEQNE